MVVMKVEIVVVVMVVDFASQERSTKYGTCHDF